LLVPVWLAFQALAVGETCPSSLDVEARVRTILHLRAEQELSESFLVERHEAGLYVELRAADATSIGQRTLPADGSCDELAQAAAVVLSSWLTDVHPDFAGALPPPPAPQPEPEPEPEPAPTPAPRIKTPPPPAPAPIITPRSWDFAFGIGGDYSGAQAALAGFVGAGYLARERGVGVSAMVMPMLSRQHSLGPGTVDWRRWPLGVGPALRLGVAGAAVDASAGPALAWLHFAGDHFDANDVRDGVAWGGFLNLRVSSRADRWGVFGLLDAQVYPAVTVAARDVQQEWSLPPLSLALVVGARFSP
jgi:hypothetical protein